MSVRSPAFDISAVAALSLWPVTSGTATCAGPDDRNRVTLDLSWDREPPGGEVRVARPRSMVSEGSCWVITAKPAR